MALTSSKARLYGAAMRCHCLAVACRDLSGACGVSWRSPRAVLPSVSPVSENRHTRCLCHCVTVNTALVNTVYGCLSLEGSHISFAKVRL